MVDKAGALWMGGSASGGECALAEPCRLGDLVVAVREQGADPRRSVVGLARGRVQTLWAGSDFMGGLEVSPDGRNLSWLAWDDPDMPWDSARLMVAALRGGRLREVHAVAGGPGCSAQPGTWVSDSTLVTSTEESGRWQPCEVVASTGEVIRRWTHPDEVGLAYWRAGTRPLVRTRVAPVALAGEQLWLLSASGVEPIDVDGFWSPWLAGRGAYVLGVRESAASGSALTRIDVRTGEMSILYSGGPATATGSPTPQVLALEGQAGPVRIRLYPPPGPGPWQTVVVVHGGPTLASTTLLDPGLRWLIAEGFAVAVVDYTGSAGHGQLFRDALYGRWGELDVTDCVRAGRLLLESGRARSLALRGVSAGGWTVLHALTQRDSPFAGGVAYAPVTDVAAQQLETPDFEKHYVARLVGEVERSPIQLAEPPHRPLMVVQGDQDEVVRSATTDRYVQRSRGQGAPIEYLVIEGEGHLISGAVGLARSRAAEAAFYHRLFGRSATLMSRS
jgi:dipeptidyl aminopeptidase/acylaminoacyl peptidase